MVDRTDAKKIVLLMTLGLCEAIRSKAISIDEAEYYLFKPGTMSLFKRDKEVRHIINLCTEFDAIARLVGPEHLEEVIADVEKRAKAALKKAAPCDYQQDFWLRNLMK